MKEKITIALSRNLLAKIDRLAGYGSRSAVIEIALHSYLRERTPTRDLARINRAAKRLNAEAFDVLRYQSSIE